MKILDLIVNENYVELSVRKSSNNYGDQILEFVFERPDGSKTLTYHTECEGNWQSFTKKNMLEVYKLSR